MNGWEWLIVITSGLKQTNVKTYLSFVCSYNTRNIDLIILNAVLLFLLTI